MFNVLILIIDCSWHRGDGIIHPSYIHPVAGDDATQNRRHQEDHGDRGEHRPGSQVRQEHGPQAEGRQLLLQQRQEAQRPGRG